MRMLCVRAGKITQIERESWIKIYITDDMKILYINPAH